MPIASKALRGVGERIKGDERIWEVLRVGKYARTVAARSVLCYWSNRELGISAVEFSRRLQLA